MILLALVLVFTYLLFRSGNNVQEAIRRDADARIQEAKQGITKLENKNLKLSGDLETEKGKVAGLLKDAADAKAAQQRVEIDLGKQKESTANAEKALLELRERIKWRHFPAEQESQLAEALKNAPIKGPVDLMCVLGDSEGFAFATQIDRILRDAGWTTSGVSHSIFTPPNPIGIEVRVHDAQNPPGHAGFLQKAFTAVGIEASGSEQANLPADRVLLIVGNKP